MTYIGIYRLLIGNHIRLEYNFKFDLRPGDSHSIIGKSPNKKGGQKHNAFVRLLVAI